MLLTITLEHKPATDLGYLLHKNPSRLHTAELSFGKAYVFYPEATTDRCTAALMVEVDPVGLVRGKTKDGGMLDQYVNDRPYVASSFLSSAITEFFSTAMLGRSKERPELAVMPLSYEVNIPVLACRGGESILRALFEPLGYSVSAQELQLDDKFPSWGASPYFNVTLKYDGLLKDLLSHLYVLIPVVDNNKHYFIAEDEVDKLMRRAEVWLVNHPSKETIVNRYLQKRRVLTRIALQRLAESNDPDEELEAAASAEEEIEKKVSLHEIRLEAVKQKLLESGARKVVDLGCGEGRLLRMILKEKQFTEIVGMDVSDFALTRAERNLRIEQLPTTLKKKLKIIHGSLMYRDPRIEGFDAAAVVEVIEHMDAPRLAAFERNVFEFARPAAVIVTTPNREYNKLFEGMEEGKMRHRDHRFEWTREEFKNWCDSVCQRFGYSVEISGLGPEDEACGTPSQMGVFTR